MGIHDKISFSQVLRCHVTLICHNYRSPHISCVSVLDLPLLGLTRDHRYTCMSLVI